ncbi:MAG: SMC-Scp complex subunit ScpB [Clostridia bacterium]|nr:SMC-Scp complex subunit ScpB [Clostridia bacterium]
MDMEKIDNLIESVLFALGRDISIEELSNTLNIDKIDIENSLKKLENKYSGESGILLTKIKDAYQFITNKMYYPYVVKFTETSKRQNLSPAVLETLSIIAYNPKITKSEIENIRGVSSDFAVGRLLECGLIEEVCRLNLPGKPAAYAVTKDFLKSCGIEDISELPDFENLKIGDEQLLISDIENSEQK